MQICKFANEGVLKLPNIKCKCCLLWKNTLRKCCQKAYILILKSHQALLSIVNFSLIFLPVVAQQQANSIALYKIQPFAAHHSSVNYKITF